MDKLEKIEAFLKKVCSKCKVPFALSIVIIILSALGSGKTIRQMVYAFMFKQDGAVDVLTNIFVRIKAGILIFIYCYILAVGVLVVVRFFLCEFYAKKREEIKEVKNPFEFSVENYLNDDVEKGYIIKGGWGTGKTFILKDFFKRYYRFSDKDIYNISCFGIKDRKYLIEEIEKVCEEKDNAITKKILDLIHCIPVIGDLLYHIMKKDYGLSNLKEKSIFVFDDFERITLSFPKLGNSINQNKERSPKRITDFERRENVHLNENFEILNDEIGKLSYENTMAIYQNIIESYNSVIGLINELIEQRKMKVIIIFNNSFEGSEIINQVLYEKLNCITYIKNSSVEIVDDIFRSTVLNRTFNDVVKTKEIETFFLSIRKDFEMVWSKYGYTNVRKVIGILNSFMDIIELINHGEYKQNDFMISLFYSIVLVHCSEDKSGYVEWLNGLSVGENIRLFLKKSNSNIEPIEESVFSEKICWVGLPLSASWFISLPNSKTLTQALDEFNNYKYRDLEQRLLNKTYREKKFEKIPLEYLLYGFFSEELDDLWLDDQFKTNNIDVSKTIKFINESIANDKKPFALLDVFCKKDVKLMDKVNLDSVYGWIYNCIKPDAQNNESIRSDVYFNRWMRDIGLISIEQKPEKLITNLVQQEVTTK